MAALAALEIAFELTAYSWGCGATYFTSKERIPHSDRTIAVDPRVIPYFSAVAIPGIGVRYAEDSGKDIKGKRIDIFMDTCKEAREFGRQIVHVLVLPDAVD